MLACARHATKYIFLQASLLSWIVQCWEICGNMVLLPIETWYLFFQERGTRCPWNTLYLFYLYSLVMCWYSKFRMVFRIVPAIRYSLWRKLFMQAGSHLSVLLRSPSQSVAMDTSATQHVERQRRMRSSCSYGFTDGWVVRPATMQPWS